MPRVTWPLLNDRPTVRVVVLLGGQATTIDLHADTGAGAASSAFDLLLLESDCWLCGRPEGSFIELTGHTRADSTSSSGCASRSRRWRSTPTCAPSASLSCLTASGAWPASACSTASTTATSATPPCSASRGDGLRLLLRTSRFSGPWGPLGSPGPPASRPLTPESYPVHGGLCYLLWHWSDILARRGGTRCFTKLHTDGTMQTRPGLGAV